MANEQLASGPYRGAVICLLIACVIAAIPIPTFFTWTIFAFIAAILAVVTMAQGRTLGGIGILLGAIFLPGILSLIANIFIIKTIAEAGSSHTNSHRWETTTYQPPTPAPFAPSKHVEGSDAAKTSAAPTVSTTTARVAPKLASQQIESWPSINGLELGKNVAAKIGGVVDGTTVVPLIAPRIRLHRAEASEFKWADPTFTTFLATVGQSQEFVSVGSEEATTTKATLEPRATIVGATPTVAVWLNERIDTGYTAWPKTPMLRLTKRSNAAEITTIPFPYLPAGINEENVSNRYVKRVTMTADGQIYVIWQYAFKDLTGPRRPFVADWYATETGAPIKQVQLFADDLTSSREIFDANTASKALFYGSKTYYQVADLLTGATHNVPKVPTKPRFVGETTQLTCTKGGNTPNMKIVVADEAGKIMQTRNERIQTELLVSLVGANYELGAPAATCTPDQHDDVVWQQAPYLIQKQDKYFLIVNTATGQVLGAVDVLAFFGAEITDTTIRIAGSGRNPAEARVFEIVKQ